MHPSKNQQKKCSITGECRYQTCGWEGLQEKPKGHFMWTSNGQLSKTKGHQYQGRNTMNGDQTRSQAT